MLILSYGGFIGTNFMHNILYICVYPRSLYTYFSIGCAQHLIDADRMCDSVNDTMMVLLIVTEIIQLNILLKYVYKKFKETLSDIHVCAKVRWNLLWLALGWPHL
jgi:hypothetical protein